MTGLLLRDSSLVGLIEFVFNITYYSKWVRGYNVALRIDSSELSHKRSKRKEFSERGVYSVKVAMQD